MHLVRRAPHVRDEVAMQTVFKASAPRIACSLIYRSRTSMNGPASEVSSLEHGFQVFFTAGPGDVPGRSPAREPDVLRERAAPLAQVSARRPGEDAGAEARPIAQNSYRFTSREKEDPGRPRTRLGAPRRERLGAYAARGHPVVPRSRPRAARGLRHDRGLRVFARFHAGQIPRRLRGQPGTRRRRSRSARRART